MAKVAQKLEQNYTENRLICASALWLASKTLTDILDRCGLKKTDKKYAIIRHILRTQLDKRIIMSIWGAIQEKHLPYFESFSRSVYNANPEADHEIIILQFAILHPEIKQKVFDSINSFSENFVENYSKVFQFSER